MKNFWRCVSQGCSLLLLSSLSSLAWADSFSLPVQGYIVEEATGDALTGIVDITFNVYADCDASESLLTDVQTLEFIEGIYSTSIAIPEDSFATLMATDNLCLGIQIGGEAEFSPRIEYFTTPYSMLAKQAETAAFADVATTALALDSANISSFLGSIVGNGLAVSGNTISLNTATAQSWTGTQTYTNQVSLTKSPSSSSAAEASVVINPATAVDDSKFLAIRDNGNDRFTVDKEGDVTIANSLTVSTLVNCNSLDTDANGKLACGTDDGGSDTIDATSITAETFTATTNFLLEDPTAGTNTITFDAPDNLATSYNIEWPINDGNAGQFLTTDGSGLLSWSTAAEGDITGVSAGTGLTGGGTTGDVSLAVDVGTSANKIVQLNGSAALPAVSGANLTNLNASNIATGSVSDARLSANVSLLGSSIDSAEITDATVSSLDIGGGAVGTEELQATAVTAGTYALPTITVDEDGRLTAAATGSVQDTDIANDAVDGGSGGEIADGSITVDDLATTLTFSDGDLLDLSGIDASSTSEGLKLPQATNSSGNAEGQISWDTDDDMLKVGTGSSQVRVGTFVFFGTDTGNRSASFVVGSTAGEDQIVAMNMTCNNLHFQVDTAPGSGGDAASDVWTATVQVEGSNTSLACTITNTATSCSDTSNATGAITAGQRIQLSVVETSSASGTNGASWSMVCYPD